MDRELSRYIRFEEFYDIYYQPLTPYGKRDKREKLIYTQAGKLEELWDDQNRLLILLSEKREKGDLISYHLKRVPLLPDFDTDGADVANLFLVKKFLIRINAIFTALKGTPAESLAIPFTLEKLLTSLSPEGKPKERFYLANTMSKKLQEVRRNLSAMEERIHREQKKLLQIILSETGLDFSGKDFLLIPFEKGVVSDLLMWEDYDSHYMIVKPAFSREHLNLMKKREELLSIERGEENRIIEELWSQVRRETDSFSRYEKWITRIDTLFARVSIAVKGGWVRPVLQKEDSGIILEEARYLPLENECVNRKVPYTPLSLTLNGPLNVLRGSNMAGKSVVLKTLLFMQVLAQMGFYVPAGKFETLMFTNILPITGSADEGRKGLSSFGLEMFRLIKAWEKIDEPSLLVFDEFARSTNSTESALLFSSVIRNLKRHPVFFIGATHHQHLDLPEVTRYFRMKGLNQERWHNLSVGAELSVEERINLLNQCMDYTALPDREEGSAMDALTVARLLGVPEEILKMNE